MQIVYSDLATLLTGIVGCRAIGAKGLFFTEFIEAAKVQSNDDGISGHKLAPYNANYLTLYGLTLIITNQY